MNTKIRFLFGIVIIIVLVDLIFINWKVFFEDKNNQTPIPIIESGSKESLLSTSLCSSDCLEVITEATKSLELVLKDSQARDVIEDQESLFGQQIFVSQNYVKEFFVSIGSGSTTKKEWTTLSGLEAQVNSANYSNISKVSFEASLRIPTGNGRLEARLINLSDNVPLAETEVYVEGSQGKRLERQFNLRSGNKVYGVQLRSTMGFLGILDQARIKIVTQ